MGCARVPAPGSVLPAHAVRVILGAMQEITSIASWAERVSQNVEKVIFGKRDVIQKVLVALLSRGHVLLEDVPGVGKTILARALATSLGGVFRRIQCTPDLLPADVIGVSVFNPQSAAFEFHEGPVVANVLLVDEINRATPRTQSALLEAMAEGKVTVEGRSMPLPDPFLVIATENPVEFEGTFPLPEAQKDRFFLSLRMGYPPAEAEEQVMLSQQRLTHPVSDLQPVCDPSALMVLQDDVLGVELPDAISDYILRLVSETRADQRLLLGASPRASIALSRGARALAALKGRNVVQAADVTELVAPILRKRLAVKPDQRLRGLTEDYVIAELLQRVQEGQAESIA